MPREKVKRRVSMALADAVRIDTMADWQKHGKEVLCRVREEQPEVYLSFVSRLIPRPAEAQQSRGGQIIISWSDGAELPVNVPAPVLTAATRAINTPLRRALEHRVDADPGTDFSDDADLTDQDDCEN
jgi:hypothetical protein